jgi:transcriptional regulator with XRE-family HTH domain
MFLEKFLNLCAKKGLSPNAVAKELGIASGTISEWKKGRSPKNSTLKKLSDYFGVSVDYLLGKEEQTKQNTPDEPKLTEGEKMLLDLFRRIPEDKQQLVLQMIRAASGSQE